MLEPLPIWNLKHCDGVQPFLKKNNFTSLSEEDKKKFYIKECLHPNLFSVSGGQLTTGRLFKVESYVLIVVEAHI